MEKMYAVFFTAGMYEDAYTVLICVTADKQKANDLVALATLEYEEARKVPLPARIDLTAGRNTANWIAQVEENKQRRAAYKEQLQKILTVDPRRANEHGLDNDGEYYHEEVEVR